MATEPTKTDYTLASGEKQATGVVDGVAVDDSQLLGYNADIQPHKCCGGCCDMRRAVIIVNIINSCFLALGLMSFTYISTTGGGAIDDDEIEEAFTSLKAGMGALIAITAAKLIFSLVGIYGAYTYNVMMVGISCASYCLEALLALITLNLASVIYCAFFAYPHFFFIREARAGIMTKENYHTVEYSCCCV